MAALNFDASQVAPDTGFGELLPKGWYNVSIDESEIKPTKDAATTGNAMLTLRFTVLGGKYNGRKLFERFNIKNTNPTAQEIAYKQLSAVAHACLVLMVQDSQQLHGIPLKAHVKIRAGGPKDASQPNGEKYEDNNQITAYRNYNEPVQLADDAPAAPGAAGGAPAGFAAPGFAAPATGFAAPNPAAFAAGAGTPPAFGQPAAATAPATSGFAGFAAPAPVAAQAPAFAAQAPAPAAVAPAFAAPAFVAPAAPAAPVWPPEGWAVHPQSADHYWKGTEVITKEELAARYAPAAPAAPAGFTAPAFVAPAAAAPAAAAANPAAVAGAQAQVPPWARPAA